MKLPPHLYEAPFFQFSSVDDLRAAATSVPAADIDEAGRLAALGLPPVVSVELLSIILGLNPGILWSFCNKPARYYRTFTIKKGAADRVITAPKVGLKIIQKWMSYGFSTLQFEDHIYGFVPGRSHIGAAHQHKGAEWAISVDIRDFFPSTPRARIIESLIGLSYSLNSAEIIANLNTLDGFLVQGSPASPSLSNITFAPLDIALRELAQHHNCVLTRYADDITFSGSGLPPPGLLQEVELILAASPWSINPGKTETQPIKDRIKIHGLLIKPDCVRLTKGYRNRIRAYSHVLRTRRLNEADVRRLLGHINYANQVNTSNGLPQVLGLHEVGNRKEIPDTQGFIGRVLGFFTRLK